MKLCKILSSSTLFWYGIYPILLCYVLLFLQANRISKEEVGSVLVDVCEECEELLVKAGRKYRSALSIDGNDMRALYNWGLALSFRAQLIADIGPVSISLGIINFYMSKK